MRNSDELVKACFLDLLPSLPTLVDYFGNAWQDEEKACIVLGLYQGLVKFRDVDSDTLHNSLMKNKLNDLVHSKYKNNESGYYNLFCNLKIDLNKSCWEVLYPKENS